MARSGSRNRAPIFATTAVLVALGIGASTVALVGSAHRRDDRAAYLRYERALLPSLSEGGMVVVRQMRPSLRELREGSLTNENALARAAGWRTEFERIRADVIALDPPSFLGDVERRWTIAIDAYLRIPALFERAAKATGAARPTLLDETADAGSRADKLFDRAASIIQAHRRRLGLGATHGLPDPEATAR